MTNTFTFRSVTKAAAILLILLPRAAMAADPSALHSQGLKAMAAGDWKTAVDALEQATAAAPDDLVVGTDYRQAVIKAAAAASNVEPYNRCVALFQKLVLEHPKAANAYLNLGFATVDRIPVEGAITQVILADKAITYFGKALEIEPTWLGFYSRGHAYLFWPPIFGRVDSGISDLEKAVAIAREKGDHKNYYARSWAALGDGFWRKEDIARSREIWKEGLALYPNDEELKARFSRTDPAALDSFLKVHYDTTVRVSTSLNEIYGNRLDSAK